MAGMEKCKVVYRYVGDIAQVEEEVCPSFVENAVRFIDYIMGESRDRLNDIIELEALEWHRGAGEPSDENLVASFNRRSLGLFDYENAGFGRLVGESL